MRRRRRGRMLRAHAPGARLVTVRGSVSLAIVDYVSVPLLENPHRVGNRSKGICGFRSAGIGADRMSARSTTRPHHPRHLRPPSG